MIPGDRMVINAVAVAFQILTNIVTLNSRMTVGGDVGLVVEGCAFDIYKDRVEFVGVGGEPRGVRGWGGFAAECAHVISGPTEDDHLWNCFVAGALCLVDAFSSLREIVGIAYAVGYRSSNAFSSLRD